MNSQNNTSLAKWCMKRHFSNLFHFNFLHIEMDKTAFVAKHTPSHITDVTCLDVSVSWTNQWHPFFLEGQWHPFGICSIGANSGFFQCMTLAGEFMILILGHKSYFLFWIHNNLQIDRVQSKHQKQTKTCFPTRNQDTKSREKKNTKIFWVHFILPCWLLPLHGFTLLSL